MQRLFIKCYRYIIEKIKAVADKFSIFIFKRLKKAVELRIIAVENVKWMVVFLEKDILNI